VKECKQKIIKKQQYYLYNEKMKAGTFHKI